MSVVGPRQKTSETILGWLKRILSSDEERVEERESEADEGEKQPRQRTMTEFAFETGRMPEEYVVELLTSHEGEMSQQEIIAETGWSRSSVSRLLCGMETEDAIVRVRLGNGNVVYLPDAIPELVQEFESTPMAHA